MQHSRHRRHTRSGPSLSRFEMEHVVRQSDDERRDQQQRAEHAPIKVPNDL